MENNLLAELLDLLGGETRGTVAGVEVDSAPGLFSRLLAAVVLTCVEVPLGSINRTTEQLDEGE